MHKSTLLTLNRPGRLCGLSGWSRVGDRALGDLFCCGVDTKLGWGENGRLCRGVNGWWACGVKGWWGCGVNG